MRLDRSGRNPLQSQRTVTSILTGVWVILLFMLASPGPLPAQSPQKPRVPVKHGDPLPRITFPNSLTPSERKYLGIGPKKNFSLEEINTRMLLIDFINSNCHYCIESVPIINEIYRSIEQDPTLRSRVKLFAVGAGDTLTEVEGFKNTRGALFPILPDTEFRAHEAIGEPRVPFLIIARKEGRGRWVVADTKVGLMGTMESKTITYLEEDPLVETVKGDIFSVGNFMEELKALLAATSEPAKPPSPSK